MSETLSADLVTDFATKAAANSAPELGQLLVPLLKGVLYQEREPRLWQALLDLQARVRDYLAVLQLELVLDEAEGYAFLRSRHLDEEALAPESTPRLIARRQLSFPVSLMLALLRKKLAEFDASGAADGASTRLVLNRAELVEMVRVFLPETSNEVKLIDQIDAHIKKIVELGFLRPLKTSGSGKSALAWEVSRILKAFVDAQWLAQLDERLAGYQAHVLGQSGPDEAGAEAGNE